MPQVLIAAFYVSLGWLTRLSLSQSNLLYLYHRSERSLGLSNKLNTLIRTLH
jgi:hypothetical protein